MLESKVLEDADEELPLSGGVETSTGFDNRLFKFKIPFFGSVVDSVDVLTSLGSTSSLKRLILSRFSI